jgi:hypothetical protein
VDPRTAVKEMRNQLPPEAWLKENQVQAYFSKMTADVRKRLVTFFH